MGNGKDGTSLENECNVAVLKDPRADPFLNGYEMDRGFLDFYNLSTLSNSIISYQAVTL